MEAYYHNEPRIQEWVENIIEKIFTSCLLTGVDSEAEYQKGCEIVSELTTLLRGLSMFPQSYISDGLKQIVEQQLPDSRIINNFPLFQNVMNKMLNEGMLKVIDPQTIEDNQTFMINTNQTEKLDEKQSGLLLPYPEGLNNDPGLVPANNHIYNELVDDKTGTAMPVLASNNIINVSKEIENMQSRSSKKTERLNTVLSNTFPKDPIDWNITLYGQEFLAQVNDILICCKDLSHPCQTEIFTKEGWKVLVLYEEDLVYPRRLEREIKKILRSRKIQK